MKYNDKLDFPYRVVLYFSMERGIAEEFNRTEKVYTVVITRDKETGNKTHEKWFLGNQFHREDGLPAIQAWDAKTAVCVSEAYYSYGNMSRVGAPASIRRHPLTGEVVGETWSVGSLQRDGDLPAIWMKNLDTGIIEFEEWYRDGVLHRDGGKPAVIVRDPQTGVITQLEYHDYGEEIRIDENPLQSPGLHRAPL